jgi:two-component system sensor histidine kinase TctE
MESRRPARAIWKQLLLWILIPSTLLWITAVADTFYVALRITGAMLDNDLEDSARIIASRIELVKGEPELTMSDDAIEILRGDGPARLFYAIRRADGVRIRGDSSLPLPTPSELDLSVETVEIGMVKMRMNTLRVPVPGLARPVYVQVAESLAERDAIIGRTIDEVLIPMGCMLLAAAACVAIGIRRGLAPLNALAKNIEGRSSTAVDPIDTTSVPLEIQPLVGALNDLLTRLMDEMLWQKRFISTTAHQLRTPLAGLKTNWELLKRETGTTDENIRPLVGVIDLTIERLVRMVNQLLSLARAEPGAQGHVERVNLSKVVEHVAVELAPHAARKNIELDVSGVAPGMEVEADANHLFDLVMNLLDNAIRYTPGPGKVLLELDDQGGGTRLAIEDDGPGIPPQYRDRVVEPFFRVPGSSPEGTGLGLAIAREIAERYGGVLSVESALNERGARVVITFPEKQREAAETSRDPSPALVSST